MMESGIDYLDSNTEATPQSPAQETALPEDGDQKLNLGEAAHVAQRIKETADQAVAEDMVPRESERSDYNVAQNEVERMDALEPVDFPKEYADLPPYLVFVNNAGEVGGIIGGATVDGRVSDRRGVYNSNGGVLTAVDHEGNTHVSYLPERNGNVDEIKRRKMLAKLEAAGYVGDGNLYVPFSNGELPVDRTLRDRLVDIKHGQNFTSDNEAGQLAERKKEFDAKVDRAVNEHADALKTHEAMAALAQNLKEHYIRLGRELEHRARK